MQTSNEAQSPLVALDLLRGLAALTVLVSHLRGNVFVEFGLLPDSQRDALAALFFAATRLAYEAVIVFFVLSGFLVGGQVLARLQKQQFSIYEYAIDRLTRILIPLIPACLFTAAVDLFMFQRSPDILQLVANMIGLNEIITPSLETNGVLWSLTYEIWFYILAGALAYVASQRINAIALLVLAACGIVFAILQTRYLAFWIIGACLSLCVNIRFKGTLAVFGILFVVVGTLFYQLAAPSRSLTSISPIPPILAESLICLGVAISLPLLASKAVNRSLLRIGPLAGALAAFSYTLYLTHRPMDALLGYYFGKAEVLSIQSFMQYGARLLICIAAATCFYFCFERNTAAARKYLRMYRARRQARLLAIGDER